MDNMKNEGTQRKCAHEPCACLIPSTQEYCSAYCSEADDVEKAEFLCACCHENCMLGCSCNLSLSATALTRLPKTV